MYGLSCLTGTVFFYVGRITVNYWHYPCDLALQVVLSLINRRLMAQNYKQLLWSQRVDNLYRVDTGEGKLFKNISGSKPG